MTDTQDGAVRTYVNPLGTPFAPIQDTSAFATCDAAATTQASFDGELAARFDGDGELVLDEQSVSLAARVAAERRAVDDLVEAAATTRAAARPLAAPSTGVNGPQGSDYDFQLLLGKDVDGDGSIDPFSLGAGTGDNRVLFDGNAELLDAYCCNLNTRPSVVESFVANGNGTSTLTITATSPNGTDLFPGGLTGDGQTLTDAIISIGFWNGAEPLDWSPAPVVQSATVELFDSNASVGGCAT